MAAVQQDRDQAHRLDYAPPPPMVTAATVFDWMWRIGLFLFGLLAGGFGFLIVVNAVAKDTPSRDRWSYAFDGLLLLLIALIATAPMFVWLGRRCMRWIRRA